MKKQITSVILTLLLPALVFAQTGNDKTTLGIANFTSSNDSDQNAINVVDNIKQLVNKEFTARQSFTIIDKSLYSNTEQGLIGVTDDASIYSKLSDVTQQNGGQFFVTGKINYNEQQNSVPSNPLDPNSAQVNKYIESLSFSLTLVDVVTNKSTFSETYTCNSSALNADAALNKAYALAACKIKYAVLGMFPVQIHIIKLDEVDKKGKLKKVLIDQGENLFSGNMTQGGGCVEEKKAENTEKPKMFDFSAFSRKKGTELAVILVDVLTVNGKDYPQEKQIGKLEVDKTEGPDLTSCIVKEGDKEIADSFTNKKNIKIKIL